MNSRKSFLAAVGGTLVVGMAIGCGDANPPADATPTPGATWATSTPSPTPTPSGTAPVGGSYLPLKVGNTWTRVETDIPTQTTSTETVTVVSFGPIGGEKGATEAFKLRYVNNDSGRMKEEWEEDRGVVVLRHREVKYAADGTTVVHEAYFNPSKLIVDMQPARLAQGAKYYESYEVKDIEPGLPATIGSRLVTWTVDATGEAVTTSAGSISCLRLHRVSESGQATPSEKTYWFGQNVGKVKIEEPGKQIELLQSYTLAP